MTAVPRHLIVALALLAPGIIAEAAGGKSFEVQGEVERSDHPLRRSAQPGPFHYSFSVAVDGSKYFIRVVPSFGQTEPEQPYFELAFDGRQQYGYYRSGQPDPRKQGVANKSVDSGIIGYHSIPSSFADDTLQVLWFAFASGSEFRNGPPAEFPPIWGIGVPVQLQAKAMFPMECQLADRVLNLPDRAIFRSTGKQFVYDEVKERVLAIPHLPPYDRGFVIAEYAASGHLGLAGGLVPKAGHFSLRAFVRSNNPPVLVTSYEVRFKVTNAVESADRSSYVPQIVAATGIGDTRVRNRPLAASYIATQWLAVTDRIVTYQFKQTEEARRGYNESLTTRSGRGLTRLLFFVMVTAALIAAVVNHLRKKHQPQS